VNKEELKRNKKKISQPVANKTTLHHRETRLEPGRYFIILTAQLQSTK